ncbi:MAG: hypothetical protein HRU20_00185 [Pseudomonadales bacterium]|nr:hypothetical protein [Pseudomonadales bacterium]
MPSELIICSLIIAFLATAIRAYRGLSVFSYVIILALSLLVPFIMAFLLVFFKLTAGNPEEYRPFLIAAPLIPLFYAMFIPVRKKHKHRALKPRLIQAFS